MLPQDPPTVIDATATLPIPASGVAGLPIIAPTALARHRRPAQAPPEETFRDHRALEIGGLRRPGLARLQPHAPTTSSSTLPDRDTPMLVDIANLSWAPVCQSNLTEDMPGYIRARPPR